MEFMRVFHLLHKENWRNSVFFFIAFFSFAHIGSNNHESEASYQDDELPINFRKALVIGNKCKLTAVNTDNINNNIEIILKTVYSETCSFDFNYKKNIYYTYSDSISSQRDGDGSELQIPSNYNAEKKLHNIYDVAVDFINEKLYIITVNNEVESDKLMVFDIDSGKLAIVISDLTSPKYIEVDPWTGLLFIQQQSEILRANMDGTSRVNLKPGKSISKFTIDRNTQSIFWATSEVIEISDYNNENRRKVTSIKMSVRGLAVLGDELFWLSTPYGLTNPSSTVFRCNMRDSPTCGKTSVIPFEEPQTIKAYNFDTLVNLKINSCNLKNVKCDHLCLLKNTTKGYSCACAVGYKLKDDMHGCQLAYDEFLLYIQDHYAKGRIIGSQINDSMNSVDAIYPIGLESNARFVSFDYDIQNNDIYFTDNTPGNNKLYKKKLEAALSQTTIYSYDGIEILSTAIDWVSKNIYQLVSRNSSGYSCAIMVHHYPQVENRKATKVYSMELLKLTTSRKAGFIVVHPLQGFIFITIRSNTTEDGQIFRANLDGSDLMLFHTGTSFDVLAIDFQEDTLYWFNSNKTRLIRRDFYDIVGSEMIDVSVVKNPTSVSVNSDYAYVGNSTTVWRFDKYIGENPIEIIGTTNMNQPKTIIGTRLYGEIAQPARDLNPCTFNNGGCEKFCFAVRLESENKYNKPRLQRRCECLKGERLSLDGLYCEPLIPQEIY